MEHVRLIQNTDCEIKRLQEFLRSNWKSDHVFTYKSDLLKWQHKSRCNPKLLNFMVGFSEDGHSISSCLGIIPSSLDKNMPTCDLMWLALWKSNSPLQGIALLNKAINYFKPKQVAALGINKEVSLLYKTLGYTCGVFQHYYLSVKSDPNHAFSVTSRPFVVRHSAHNLELETCSSLITPVTKQFFANGSISFNNLKTLSYMEHRYADHPNYEYFGISLFSNSGTVIAVLIAREITTTTSKCWRIVDCCNLSITCYSHVQQARRSLINLLLTNDVEYIDMLASEEAAFIPLSIGLIKKSDSDRIPHYFEPYDSRNIEVSYAFKNLCDTRDENNINQVGIFFKGDSDMDRPNI
jgi:hypothetical protein